LERVDANRERSLPVFNNSLRSGLGQIRNASACNPSICGAWLRCAIGSFFVLTAWCPLGRAQEHDQAPASAAEVRELREVVQSLLTRVADLESQLKQQKSTVSGNIQKEEFVAGVAPTANMATAITSPAVESAVVAGGATTTGAASTAVTAQGAPLQAPKEQGSAGNQGNVGFLHGATLNFLIDEYYEYNFNNPVGRVNALRAYDVLSNNISLNQADVVFEKAPDVDAGQRFGMRLDLQFGQATDTLQGNPSNEPRPDIYRNIFQAYGTYVAPIGNGLTVDVGKFGSSIGIEGNYTKDQMNYSRAYWFNYLPFYHMGVRAAYKVNDKLTLNYWIVNGTNQVEATNGYKDELFGFTTSPTKEINWTVNYYIGQEHPDRLEVSPTGPIPVQPGLSFSAIRPAPNGKLHIFDTYGTWQAAPKLSFALEGDYVIEREWATTAPGESSSPSHVIGGAGYARYQFSPKITAAFRGEYLSDRGGLFSGTTQALKETTATFDYKVTDGFLMRYEWRWDFSNQPTFFTHQNDVLSKQQQTATIGVIWWFGGKEGAW
jgi:hypothetical protein